MGSTRRFTFDMALDNTEPPVAGDLMVSPRAVYRVTFARPVDSRVWGNRWHVECSKIGGPEAFDQLGVSIFPDEGGRSHGVAIYRRGETPASHFGATVG